MYICMYVRPLKGKVTERERVEGGGREREKRIEQVREQEMDLPFVASLPSGYKGQVWLI